MYNTLLPQAILGRFRRLLCLASLLVLSTCAAVAQTAFVNFNSVGEYTNNFFPWNDNAGVQGGDFSFEENPTNGVGGSGGVAVFANNDMTATYNAASWNLSTNGANVIVSIMIYTDGQSGGNKVQLGVMNSHTNGLNGNAGVSFESCRFLPDSATDWPLFEQYCDNGATGGSELGDVTVQVNHWYK